MNSRRLGVPTLWQRIVYTMLAKLGNSWEDDPGATCFGLRRLELRQSTAFDACKNTTLAACRLDRDQD